MIKRNCRNCNKDIYTYPSKLKIGRGKYCSKQCMIDYKRKNEREVYFYICEDCGEAIHIRKDHIKDRYLQYCKQCDYKYRFTDILKGERHPNWKGGKTPLNSRLRNCKKYFDWRNKVFKKDNYTCQICNKRGGHDLIVHHIKSFAYYPKLRYDLNNGIILCKDCHKYVHNYEVLSCQ